MKRLVFAIAILPWIFIACSTGDTKESSVNDISVSEVVPQNNQNKEAAVDNVKDLELPQNMNASDIPANEPTAETPVHANWDKKIIKTANVTLEVKKHDNYSSFIRNVVKKYGAYISKENSDASDYKRQTIMSIKVPAEQFEAMLDALQTNNAKQLERSISSEDVTSRMIDTKVRLETRKATRAKYMELLNRAQKMEDVLNVQREINNIQEDIESAEAILSQLSGEVKYSTIHLTYFEPLAGSGSGFGSRVLTALRSGTGLFSTLFFAFLSVWPLWLIVGAIVFIAKKYGSSRTAYKKNL